MMLAKATAKLFRSVFGPLRGRILFGRCNHGDAVVIKVQIVYARKQREPVDDPAVYPHRLIN